MKTKNLLTYKGYFGSVEYSLEDGILHGKLLFISGGVAYEADTLPELKQAFDDAVDDYLDIMAEQGAEPEKSFQESLDVRLVPERHQAVAV